MRGLRRLTALLIAAGSLALAAQGDGGAEHLQSVSWPRTAHGAGGFSGIDTTADGTGFVIVSDQGLRVEGRFDRSAPAASDGSNQAADARITAMHIARVRRLRDRDGTVPALYLSDAEGVAMDDAGGIFVSYERRHRVMRHDAAGQAFGLAPLDGFAGLDRNGGPEALAIDAAGRLWTLPETGAVDGAYPLWRLDAGGWRQVGGINRRGGFRPVGADFGPDGAFYLLERSFAGIGFRTRVRRFEPRQGGRWRESILLTTLPGRHGNLEGLAVWRDAAGVTRLTMISDDNFLWFQRTEIVEYRVRLASGDAAR